VIGNPPYIQLQSMRGALDCLEGRYRTFEKTGDIYCMFYELATKIVRDKGWVCLITGNSWIRSNFGKSLRRYLARKVQVQQVLDLSDNDIFASATVLTSIVRFVKQSPEEGHRVAAVRFTRRQKDELKNLHQSFAEKKTELAVPDDTPWIIVSGEKQKILDKVASKGIALRDWDVEINYGIKTGYNEAFIIDKATQDELIAEDENSAELIQPLLRGRDVKRYAIDYQDLYLIGTFPSLKLDIEKYHAIRDYLKSFGKRLEQSGEIGCRKKTSGQWFETQDTISYHTSFTKPKIIYPNMVSHPSFMIDEGNYYLNDKCFILTGTLLYSLCAILNSNLFRYCFEDRFPELQGNAREIKKFVLESIPIVQVSAEKEKEFQILVDEIMEKKKQGFCTLESESEVDRLVYGLYGLTGDEVKIVEGE
ncbi:MAG: TaqI-like C-terminal specificity domain-containing protein, partial [Spirochaetota bacterium]